MCDSQRLATGLAPKLEVRSGPRMLCNDVLFRALDGDWPGWFGTGRRRAAGGWTNRGNSSCPRAQLRIRSRCPAFAAKDAAHVDIEEGHLVMIVADPERSRCGRSDTQDNDGWRRSYVDWYGERSISIGSRSITKSNRSPKPVVAMKE